MAFVPSIPFHKSPPARSQAPRRRTIFTSRPGYKLLQQQLSQPSMALDTLVLTESNVQQALEEARQTLGSMFGNSADNRAVGITGDVELAELDGPVVILRLKGRFWHKRADVLARVSAYLSERIPEICDTQIEDLQQLNDSEEESSRLL